MGICLIAETRFGRDHEFLRLWTSQLYAEFDAICYQYRLRLRKPVIRVLELAGKWGTWDPNTRTICIARQLIELGNWDATVEVLKHEIAHMIVNDEMGISDHTHGDAFKTACHRLGIASWASAAQADLMQTSPGAEEEMTPAEKRLLSRAEKLLALAGSSNENEALLAMERVRELYSRYNLERLREKSRDAQFTYLTINHKKKQVPQHQVQIASILTGHFFVEAIFSSQYDPDSNEHFKTLEIIGARQNVKMAEYVYFFLLRSLCSLWDGYKAHTNKHGSFKKSFYLGVLKGFDQKLRLQANYRSPADLNWHLEEASAEMKELATIADRELENQLRYRHPRMTSRRVDSSIRDMESYEAGHVKGEQLVLRRAMEERGQGRIHQLT